MKREMKSANRVWILIFGSFFCSAVHADEFVYTKSELCERSTTAADAKAVFGAHSELVDHAEIRLKAKLRSECKSQSNAYQIASNLSRHCQGVCVGDGGALPHASEKACQNYCKIYSALNDVYLAGVVASTKRSLADQKKPNELEELIRKNASLQSQLDELKKQGGDSEKLKADLDKSKLEVRQCRSRLAEAKDRVISLLSKDYAVSDNVAKQIGEIVKAIGPSNTRGEFSRSAR